MKYTGPNYKMRMEARTRSGEKYVFESFIERSGTYIRWRYSKNKKWSDYRQNALAQLDQFNLTNRYTLQPFIHNVGKKRPQLYCSFAYWVDRRSGGYTFGILDEHGKLVGHGPSSGAGYVINRIFLTNIVYKYGKCVTTVYSTPCCVKYFRNFVYNTLPYTKEPTSIDILTNISHT